MTLDDRKAIFEQISEPNWAELVWAWPELELLIDKLKTITSIRGETNKKSTAAAMAVEL